MNKTTIYLIRHGMTIANEKRLYCGKTDIMLSHKGREKLKSLKNIYDNYEEYKNIQKYISSGAKRANETINLLFTPNEYEVLDSFWEYDFGDFEMKSYEMLKEREDYISWILDKEGDIAAPNGENRKLYNKRVLKAFIGLAKQNINNGTESSIVVCHGGTISSILSSFIKDKDFYTLQPECGCGVKIEAYKKDEDVEFKLIERIPKDVS